MKLLIYIIGGFGLLATAACLLEDYMGWNKPFRPIYAHVEMHCDRPIEEIAREIERENETESERFEREYRESERETEFGRMS